MIAALVMWAVGVDEPFTPDIALYPVAYLCLAAVGALIPARQPGNRVGRRCLLAGVLGSVAARADSYARLAIPVPAQDWAMVITAFAFPASFGPIVGVLLLSPTAGWRHPAGFPSPCWLSQASGSWPSAQQSHRASRGSRWSAIQSACPAVYAVFATFAAIPIAIGVAMLRYRLYDYDLIIRRTLVYGALTLVLGAAYVGSVLGLQALLSPFTANDGLAVAVSTLAVAALFGPVRLRVQRAVDRRFYRSRYDAQRTLEAFATKLRDEVDLGSLTDALRAASRSTVRPASASIWLRERVP